jgi:hypothetical protein
MLVFRLPIYFFKIMKVGVSIKVAKKARAPFP